MYEGLKRGAYNRTYSSAMPVWTLAADVWIVCIDIMTIAITMADVWNVNVWSVDVHDSNISTIQTSAAKLCLWTLAAKGCQGMSFLGCRSANDSIQFMLFNGS